MTNSSQIESPCVRNCCLNDDDICLGCFRSLVEIRHWHEVDDQDRLNIIEETKLRKETHRLKYRSFGKLSF